jgi:enoyl-[acyl-carrier protein] reductase I
MGILTNKRALIVGVASNRSIAYGIAQAMYREGAELAFTYQTEKLRERVHEMAQDFSSDIVLPCDVAYDEQITALFTQLAQRWDKFDILAHSIAFAPADQLEGDYLDCINRDGFNIAHEVSSYSLAALVKQAYPLMEGRKAAVVTLSYLGAERALPNYNVMGLAKASLEANVRYLAYSLGPRGIRVNGISAGPIRTLAASGIKDFRKLLNRHESMAPLRQNTTTEQVGNTAAFLCSDLADGITGEIVHVDGGFHITAMPKELVEKS